VLKQTGREKVEGRAGKKMLTGAGPPIFLIALDLIMLGAGDASLAHLDVLPDRGYRKGTVFLSKNHNSQSQ
jgi:hypothetical protein